MTTFDDRLRLVFADTFETTPDQIHESLSVDTSPDWDSMRSIVLASSLEAEFAIEFTDDELIRLDSYRKIREALLQKGVQ
jgi:acyl carrier protein